MAVSHDLISRLDQVVVRPAKCSHHLAWPLPGLTRPGRGVFQRLRVALLLGQRFDTDELFALLTQLP